MAAATMLDILSSPLRGYIAQNLQFYLSKYIEGIQLEGFGLFGGDLVLNDLEIKRHVLLESLEIPSSFDFARGFIRELRIHIPWTQLLSQPIEVKLYTIELILVSRAEAERVARRSSRTTSLESIPASTAEDDSDGKAEVAPEKIDQPKSGWLHDTLQKILANISVNNLVLKFEQEDIVLSVALGTLDFYSANARNAWVKGFENPTGPDQAIGKRIDVKDLTIFLDRYTSSGPPTDDPYLDRLRRKVVGYEVPVLTRTSVSARGKFLLRPSAAPDDQGGEGTAPSAALQNNFAKVFDIDGLFVHEPSSARDPFYSYSCSRPSVVAMHEVDVFIGELLFSLSDRQLDMIVQLVQSATRKADETKRQTLRSPVLTSKVPTRSVSPVKRTAVTVDGRQGSMKTSQSSRQAAQQAKTSSTKSTGSWMSWAMNIVAPVEDDEEDELITELLAESKRSLLQAEHQRQSIQEDPTSAEEAENAPPSCIVSCVRVCVSSVSLTLRKHEKTADPQNQEAPDKSDEPGEQFVPVAHLGMVKVSTPGKRKSKVSRPPPPILSLTLTYVALEALLARTTEREAVDLVFEVENVEVVSISGYKDSNAGKGESLLKWGSVDTSSYSDYVSHPYFTTSFFGDEARRLSKRHSRSFELVKVSFDTEIPVWRTMEVRDTQAEHAKLSREAPCSCSINWDGEKRPCIAKAVISGICEHVTASIGVKERILDEGILANSITSAWAANEVVLSITPTMQRALATIVSDYKMLRSPDESPAVNLRQHLEPNLFAMFARYALHCCPASLPSPAVVQSHDRSSGPVQQRSVHSAMRLRFARLSEFTVNEELPTVGRHQTSCADVLDISLGDAVAKLELEKCVEVAKVITEVVTEAQGPKSDASSAELPTQIDIKTLPVQVNEGCATTNSKLVTFNKFVITLSASEKDLPIALDVTGSASNLVWRDQSVVGQANASVQVGIIALDLGDVAHTDTVTAADAKNVHFPIARALGLEVSTSSSDTGTGAVDTKTELSVSLDKLEVRASFWTTSVLLASVDAYTGGILGFTLLKTRDVKRHSPVMFEVEVTRARASRILTISPRLAMSDRLDLSATIGSASLYQTSMTQQIRRDMLFQSGLLVAVAGDDGSSHDFASASMRLHKTPGEVIGRPLSSLLSRAAMKTSASERASTNLIVDVRANIARVAAHLQGVEEMTTHVIRLLSTLNDHSAGPSDQLRANEQTVVISVFKHDVGNAARAPTPWEISVDLRIQGGSVRLNTILELTVSAVTIESPKSYRGATNSGDIGYLQLVCAFESIELAMTHQAFQDFHQRVLLLGGFRAVANYWHRQVERRELHAVDAMVSIATVEASLSRLKVCYLLKIPFVTQASRLPKPPVTSRPHRVSQVPKKDTMKSSQTALWSYKVGLQVDHTTIAVAADIRRRASKSDREESVGESILGNIRSASLALRYANHHPANRHMTDSNRAFTDIQCAIAGVDAAETLQVKRHARRFGILGSVPDHFFIGVLLCLGLDDVVRVAEALSFDSESTSDQVNMPDAVRCWHLSSRMAKEFRVVLQRSPSRDQYPESSRGPVPPAVPLLCMGNDAASDRTGQSFPVLSLFSRNYSEHGQPAQFIAGSIGNVDLNVTTSSLYCVSTVLSALQKHDDRASSEGKRSDRVPETASPAQNSHPTKSLSLQDLQVFVQLGQVRVVLSSEHLFDALESRQFPSKEHACFVMEGVSVSSAGKFEISLDGLGYPPFNARLLPRRPQPHSTRFGKSDCWIGCRAGKIYGAIVHLEVDNVTARQFGNNALPWHEAGLFETELGQSVGEHLKFAPVETFLCPFSATCSIGPGVSVADSAALVLSVTKIRVDLHKTSYDVVVSRILGVLRGVASVTDAFRSRGPDAGEDKVTSVDNDGTDAARTPNHDHPALSQFDLKCDGMEVNLLTAMASIHCRVAALHGAHNAVERSGNAFIQNIVVGYRGSSRMDSAERSINEEVIFGAFADPTLWQLAVDNYQEKLVSGRWNFPEHHEGSIFLDVQAFQLHVSAHTLLMLAQFFRSQSTFVFTRSQLVANRQERVGPREDRRTTYQPTPRWALKILIAPSVISLWESNQDGDNSTKTDDDLPSSSLWVSCGEVFGSVMLGAGDAADRALKSEGETVHELNHLVGVKAADFVMSIEKIGVRVSSAMQVLQVHFSSQNGGSVPGHVASNWPMFEKYLTSASEMRRVLEESSIRLTGEHQRVIERCLSRSRTVVPMDTALSQTSVQVELSPVRIKLSSYALETMMSLLRNCNHQQEKLREAGSQGPASTHRDTTATEQSAIKSVAKVTASNISMDDFSHLRRIAEARHPLPGELAFTESLFIETASSMGSSNASVAAGKHQTALFIDCSQHDVTLSDVVSFILEANEPWNGVEHEFGGDRPPVPDLESNQTLSWVGMRWCYHIPRSVEKVIANPVPIPPTGIPREWPTWSDESASEDDRFCDILCQLRCWDYSIDRYVVVSEFYTPWDTSSGRRRDHTDSDEPDTFSGLVSQWFDDDLENRQFIASLVDVASQTRAYSIKADIASDKWELRWRHPLQREGDPKNTQTRFLINALLASSLKLSSVQVNSAYRQAVVNVSAPSVALAICYVSTSRDSHDVITAELLDSTVSTTIFNTDGGLRMNTRLASSLQVFLENMVQLLTVSVVPRVGIGAFISLSPTGLSVSGLIGPASVYLTQTSMLVLTSIPTILRRRPIKEERRATATLTTGKLSDMRIVLANESGVDIWCRQSGTTERIAIAVDERVPYSWMSLGGNPFYQMEFSLDEPSQHTLSQQDAPEQTVRSSWCDPCPIKQNCVTGRYFAERGYLWISVELRGLQTLVTLRSSFTFRNYCDFALRFKTGAEGDAGPHFCDALPSRNDEVAETATQTALVSGNSAFIMLNAVKNVDLQLSLNAESWTTVPATPDLPDAFDLVKQRDEESAPHRPTQAKQNALRCRLVVLHERGDIESRSGTVGERFAWLKTERVKCSTLSSTDLDYASFRLTRRYAWVETTLWPAITIKNTINVTVVFVITQKGRTVEFEVEPEATRSITSINPLEASTVKVSVAPTQNGEVGMATQAQFGLCEHGEFANAVHQLGSIQIVTTRPINVEGNAAPSVRILVERYLTVHNMTPLTLSVKVKNVEEKTEAQETIPSCGFAALGCAPGDKLVVSIGIGVGAEIHGEAAGRWSSVRMLATTGDSKVFVLPSRESGAKTLASTFAATLTNTNGRIKVTIRPHVVVTNATDCALRVVPTDGAGSVVTPADEVDLIQNEGWSLPVCLHKDAKRRSLTNGVSTWLNAKFSRRPSEDLPALPVQPQVARLSCSFKICVADESDDGFEWSEEVTVRLPSLPLVVTKDGDISLVESPRTTATNPSPPDGRSIGYPQPSSVTPRRRLLIRHKAFRHKMLTYTVTQTETSIQIAFFIDHQAPVVVLNQWSQALGFRNVAAASKPEAVSPSYYLEYDWSLQERGSAPLSQQLDRAESASVVQEWLDASANTLQYVDPAIADDKRVRFQIGTPEFGWSNALWQVGGIQFATLMREDDNGGAKITFLVMCHYRAGSWVISVTCLEDDTAAGYQKDMPPLMLPSTASLAEAKKDGVPKFLHLSIKVEELGLHLCDEYDPYLNERGMAVYPEVFRVACRSVVVAFATSPDPPETSRHAAKLGYLSHVRAYTTLFISIDDGEVDHFLEDCNFPVILSFSRADSSSSTNAREFAHHDVWQELSALDELFVKLLDKRIPDVDQKTVVVRVTYTDTWDPTAIPSYFHSIELKLAPAVLQVEDAILSHVYALLKPITDALNGSAALTVPRPVPGTTLSQTLISAADDDWSSHFRKAVQVAMQQKVFIEELVLSDVELTVTARVTIPVLNSFDGTPLRFGVSRMRNVFTFPDQLLKDLAADYVADAIVRSPMLIMSLNILGNPAGFFRNFSVGIRNLVEIPLAATRDGYNPWVLSKGVVGGVASFVGHAAAATLMSISGFSYSISRTMDQLTLPSGQLQKRRYRRPTRLASGLADGLGALGSSVVGAATGVITTPIAVYKERQLQGLDPGVGNVVSGLGMGLVGVVARPVGGMASLISLASDGILYGSGMGETRLPFEKTDSVLFDARPNELLRYKLKVLPDAAGTLVYAHGAWVDPVVSVLVVPSDGLHYIEPKQEDGSTEDEELRRLITREDEQHSLVAVTLVSSSTHLYVVGRCGEQQQVVLARCALLSVQAIEESLVEPTVLDLGVNTDSVRVEWLRLRLAASQRRRVSNQLRLWLADSK